MQKDNFEGLVRRSFSPQIVFQPFQTTNYCRHQTVPTEALIVLKEIIPYVGTPKWWGVWSGR